MAERIVVTGGAGRIGGHVVEELQDDYDVVVFDRVPPARRPRVRARVGDHENLGEVLDACQGASAILHLSAIPSPRTYPDQTVFRTNVMGTFTVHQAAALLGIGTVVSTSSQSAFGWAWTETDRVERGDFLPHYLPLDEDHPDEPDDAYGLSKLVGEQIALAFHRKTGMRCIVLRPPLVTFPDSYDGLRKRIAAGQQSWSDAIFTYLDARDLATAFRAALERREVQYGVFNVAADDSLATEPLCDLLPRIDPRLAEMAKALTGRQPMVSNAKIKRLLGWRSQYTWRDNDV